MSATAEESQKPKKQCVMFEPQAWRKTLCRNCFKTKNDHNSSSDADDQQKNPTSPVVNDGDVVILRREGTPMKDRSRSVTPTPAASSTPAISPTATPAGNNIITPDQDTSTLVSKKNKSGTIKDAASDKGREKTSNKTSSEVDKKNSQLSNTSAATTAKKAQTKSEAADVKVGKDEPQKADQDSTAEVNHTKRDDGKTTVDSKQCADSKPATAQQSTTAALSQTVENNKASSAVDIQGHTAAFEAPTTSAAGSVAVAEAVNSSAVIKSPYEVGAQTSVSPATQPQRAVESSPADGNASSPHVMVTKEGQNDTQTMDDTSCTRETSNDGDGSSSNTITRCIDDAAASVVAAAAAASVASPLSAETSDEIIGDVARSVEAGLADDTKIDRGSGERSAVAVAGVEDAAATVPGEVNAGVSEDSQRVRQLDLTPDQLVDVCATTGVPGLQSGLFTNDDVAKRVDSRSDSASTSSISLATAADDTAGAAVEQQSPRLFVDISAAPGHDFAPEVTSWDSAAGHGKVEATITLSGSSSPYVVDNSRPIHIVSGAGISGYQRGGGGGGVWTSDASQNVENFVVGAERGRLPPDYEQSAGYSSSSVSDDEYGPTSPLVDYLSRSPFARPLQGATERSPETEIVATRGGGETSLFHHVPGDSDESTAAAGVNVAELSSDTRDWETGQSRNGAAERLTANSDTDNRLIHTYDHFSRDNLLMRCTRSMFYTTRVNYYKRRSSKVFVMRSRKRPFTGLTIDLQNG